MKNFNWFARLVELSGYFVLTSKFSPRWGCDEIFTDVCEMLGWVREMVCVVTKKREATMSAGVTK